MPNPTQNIYFEYLQNWYFQFTLKKNKKHTGVGGPCRRRRRTLLAVAPDPTGGGAGPCRRRRRRRTLPVAATLTLADLTQIYISKYSKFLSKNIFTHPLKIIIPNSPQNNYFQSPSKYLSRPCQNISK